MADFNWVTDRLAVGGAVESLYDARKIAAAGITHVLNLRMNNEDEKPWFDKLGLEYLHNGAEDDGQKKPVEWFEESLDFVMGALLADPKARVLVHCKSGINRGPSTAYACLRAWGTPADDAREHVKEARPKAQMRYADDGEAAVKKLGYVDGR